MFWFPKVGNTYYCDYSYGSFNFGLYFDLSWRRCFVLKTGILILFLWDLNPLLSTSYQMTSHSCLQLPHLSAIYASYSIEKTPLQYFPTNWHYQTRKYNEIANINLIARCKSLFNLMIFLLKLRRDNSETWISNSQHITRVYYNVLIVLTTMVFISDN